MPFSIIGHLKHLRKMSRVRRGTEEGCDGYRRSLQETGAVARWPRPLSGKNRDC